MLISAKGELEWKGRGRVHVRKETIGWKEGETLEQLILKWTSKAGKWHCRKLAMFEYKPTHFFSLSLKPQHCLKGYARQSPACRWLWTPACFTCGELTVAQRHWEWPAQSLCVKLLAAWCICLVRARSLENSASWVLAPLPGWMPSDLSYDPASAPVFQGTILPSFKYNLS